MSKDENKLFFAQDRVWTKDGYKNRIDIYREQKRLEMDKMEESCGISRPYTAEERAKWDEKSEQIRKNLEEEYGQNYLEDMRKRVDNEGDKKKIVRRCKCGHIESSDDEKFGLFD